MKKLVILFFCIFLYANSYNIIKNIIGNKYNIYENLIKTSLDKNASMKQVLIFIKNNGFLNLKFKKPKTIYPSFLFTSSNDLLKTKILYESLNNLGFYDFYPVQIIKNSKYKITLEINTLNKIDPLNFYNILNQHGCNITNITNDENFTYYINCKNPQINTYNLKDSFNNFHNIKGVYWFRADDYSKVSIKTSKYDFFYPYIVFYDKNLNILNIITSKNIKRKLTLKIPVGCFYIKIEDNYTKENIKRGIFIKGIK